MTDEPKKRKTGYPQLQKNFWELSLGRKNGFLKVLYESSATNKDLFRLYLGEDSKIIVEDLKKKIRKETSDKAGRFAKIRISKINELIKSSEQYPLEVRQKLELQKEVWMGLLAYLIALGWASYPERYQVSCAKYITQYLRNLDEIMDREMKEELLADSKRLLKGALDKGL